MDNFMHGSSQPIFNGLQLKDRVETFKSRMGLVLRHISGALSVTEATLYTYFKLNAIDPLTSLVVDFCDLENDMYKHKFYRFPDETKRDIFEKNISGRDSASQKRKSITYDFLQLPKPPTRREFTSAKFREVIQEFNSLEIVEFVEKNNGNTDEKWLTNTKNFDVSGSATYVFPRSKEMPESSFAIGKPDVMIYFESLTKELHENRDNRDIAFFPIQRLNSGKAMLIISPGFASEELNPVYHQWVTWGLNSWSYLLLDVTQLSENYRSLAEKICELSGLAFTHQTKASFEVSEEISRKLHIKIEVIGAENKLRMTFVKKQEEELQEDRDLDFDPEPKKISMTL